MAYDKNKLLKEAIKQIKENNLFFVEDLVTLLPCSKSTFYKLFDTESKEYEKIKKELNKNRVLKKIELRAKMEESGGAGLIALYKLLATKEELQALTGNFHTVKQANTVRNIEMTAEEAQEIARKLDEKLDI